MEKAVWLGNLLNLTFSTFQRKMLQAKGCQIDYLIQTKTLYVCEIKFTHDLDSSKIIAQMKEKMAAFSLQRGFSAVPVLIHFSDDEVSDAMQEYFYKVIHFGEFLKTFKNTAQ